jgi:hypothetical protein
MSFGDLKVQDLIYEDSSNNEITVVIADLATKANPVFSGTVTVPTATANDNTTKAASTAYVQTELGDYLTTATATSTYAPKNAPAFTGSATGVNLTLSGDLTVNGTTTTINTTTLQVEDKNIEIGKVSSPSDTTADGGGWTLLGSTSKTFNWLNATDSWTSSEHIEIASGKNLKVDGTTLFVDGTNNRVGIGSASPTYPLDLTGNSAGGFVVARINNTASNGYARILLDREGGSTGSADISYAPGVFFAIGPSANDTNTPIVFRNNNASERFRIAPSGQLGIAGANYGSSGQVLTSGGSGAAPSWANPAAGGNTIELVADGAIAAGKPVIIKSNGKAAQVAESLSVTTSPIIDTNGVAQGGTGSSYHDFGPAAHDNMAYDPVSDMTLLIWRNTNASGTNLYYRIYESTGGGFNEITAARSSAPDETNSANFACCSLSNRRFAVCYEVSSGMKIQIGQVASDGSNITWGSSYFIDGQSGQAGSYREPHLVAIGDDRIALFARANNTLCEWGQNKPGILVGDVTSTNVWNFRDGSLIDGTHNCDGQWRDITYDSTNDIIAFVWRRDSTDTNDYIMGGRVSSGTSPTFTFGTPLQHTTGTVKNRVRYNSVKNIFVTAWESSSLFYMKAHTINSTTLAVTAGTAVNWNHGMSFKSLNLVTSNEGGAFSVVIGNTDSTTRIVSASFAGTNNLTITLNSSTNQPVCSNYGSANEACCVYVAHTGRVLSAVRSGSGSAASMVLGTNKTTASTTNFTSSQRNFLGFAEDAISDGATGTIKLDGNVVGNQSGLTAGTLYKVDNDGTLTGSWGSNEVGLLAVAADKGVVMRSLA